MVTSILFLEGQKPVTLYSKVTTLLQLLFSACRSTLMLPELVMDGGIGPARTSSFSWSVSVSLQAENEKSAMVKRNRLIRVNGLSFRIE